jgi:hypothetical protein
VSSLPVVVGSLDIEVRRARMTNENEEREGRGSDRRYKYSSL